MSMSTSGPPSQRIRLAYGAILFVAIAFALAWIFALPRVEDFFSTDKDPSQTATVSSTGIDFPAAGTQAIAPTSGGTPTITPATPATPHGSDEWGLTDADLELAHIDWDADPPTVLFLRIRNYGLGDFAGEIEAICSGGGILRSALMCPDCPARDPVDFLSSAWMEIPVSHHWWTFYAELGRALDPWNYNYIIECMIGTDRDPDDGNNSLILAYP